METTVGNPMEQRPEDVEAAKRRANVQQVFETNKSKEDLMNAMVKHQISVTELAQAMDYKIDALAYLRDLGCPDGFMGLKVWPADEVARYYAWQKVTPNALNLEGIKPSPAQVQATMDREFANNAINPAHPIPWH
jgi:hypothetical protein